MPRRMGSWLAVGGVSILSGAALEMAASRCGHRSAWHAWPSSLTQFPMPVAGCPFGAGNGAVAARGCRRSLVGGGC